MRRTNDYPIGSWVYKSWPRAEIDEKARLKKLNQSKEKALVDVYVNLGFDDYKNVEAQMKAFAETEHGNGTEYYHKSIRIKITDELTYEFHGPNVMARKTEEAPK